MIVALRSGVIAAAMGIAVSGTAMAQGLSAADFDIREGSLESALKSFAEQAGMQLLYRPEDVNRMKVGPLKGKLPKQQALRQLLLDSGLEIVFSSDNAATIRPAAKGAAPKGGSAEVVDPLNGVAENTGEQLDTTPSGNASKTLDTVRVTGTRIQGVSTPSPTIVVTSENMREEGFTDLGDVVRSLPQNFAGGQNPGMGIGQTGGNISNQNITGGSSINLRGLGPDATLTLLNGRRLAYSGFVNAVDVSIIPTSVVERMEVITDGASAIYGSDAVAGVANIITKRDYDGLEIAYDVKNFGAGGGLEHRYSIVGGTTWNSGGFIAGYRKVDAEPVYAEEYDHLSYMYAPYSLYPSRKEDSGFLSVHQEIGDVARLSMDALYSERSSERTLRQTTTYYDITDMQARSYVVSPGLEIFLPKDWTLTLGATQSKTKDSGSSISWFDGNPVPQYMTYENCYCNEGSSLELGGEGPIFALPGGQARLAIGVGERQNDLAINGLGSPVSGAQESRFGYAELYMPVFGEEQAIPGIRRFEISAALRQERYDDMDSVTTPKIGIIYQPSNDFTVKASWGESFKLPTLMQRYQAVDASVWPVRNMGGTGYPATATVLLVAGGNTSLRPETSTSLTTSVVFHPSWIPGFRMELSYFDVMYSDRIVSPISSTATSLVNPLFEDFINFEPTADLVRQIVATTPANRARTVGGARYNPDTVVAIVYNPYTNAVQQDISGIDLSASYGFSLAGGKMTVRGSGSWLDRTQRLLPWLPEEDRTGIAFNSAKFRARAGLTWSKTGMSVSGFLSHVGGPIVYQSVDHGKELGSFTTLDLTARYSFQSTSVWGRGVSIGVSIQNALDRLPPLFMTENPARVNWDTTNHNGLGRSFSLNLSKRW